MRKQLSNEAIAKLRFCRFSGSFEPIFDFFEGGNINIRILSPSKKSKIGQNNPEKRQNLNFATASKRSFILLEVLLALTLVILCAIPLIIKPIRTYRFEMKALEEVEGERLADWTFSEIKELMLKKKIPWEKLPSHNETTGPFPLETGSIQVPGREPKKIERSFTLFGKGEKEGIAGETYRMIYVKIEFNPILSKKKKIYTYRLPVQRIQKIDEP